MGLVKQFIEQGNNPAKAREIGGHFRHLYSLESEFLVQGTKLRLAGKIDPAGVLLKQVFDDPAGNSIIAPFRQNSYGCQLG
jgi:hypothetical protein